MATHARIAGFIHCSARFKAKCLLFLNTLSNIAILSCTSMIPHMRSTG
ncbi:unnamed protein product [Ixodes persulcatus]